MSFKYKELFVLFVILEAINGLTLDTSSNGQSPSKDLAPVDVTTEKFLNVTVDKGTTESVKVIIPKSSNILPKSSESQNNTTTTTVAPSQDPQPWEAGRWVVRNTTTNTTCIIAEMAMQLDIIYPGNDLKVHNASINVPANSTGIGSCAETPQFVNISWGPGYSLLINFGMNKTAKNYFVSGIALNVNATVLKDAADDIQMLQFTNNSLEFATPLDMSYKCNKIQNVNLEAKHPNTTAVLNLKNAQIEAYMNKKKAEFSAAQDCDAFDTPDIVPIAVGCALAILVLVVLVAYLIARKRSHNQGYLSM